MNDLRIIDYDGSSFLVSTITHCENLLIQPNIIVDYWKMLDCGASLDKKQDHLRVDVNSWNCPLKLVRPDCLTLIREFWKKIKNAGPSPSAFRGKKIQSVALHHFVYVSVFLIFFPKTRSAMVPKNDIYFCSSRHIFSHIGICHLKLASQDSPTDTLSAYTIFIF